jgi:alpha-glucoside transport system substrate-binding protein
MKRNPKAGLAISIAAMCLLTTGCLQGGDDGDGGGGGGDTGSGDTAGAGGSEPGDGTVEVFGAFTGAEQDAFDESLTAWEEESGIDIKYTGNADFTTFVRSRVQGGQPPDIALFPQPGLLLDLAAQDNLVPIDEYLDVDELNETLIPGFLDAVTDDEDTVYGAPMRMAVKSLVWVPKAYAAAGYSLEPASVQELSDIAEEIRDTGTPPWCLGYESGAATGWVGTDWIEEMVLRVAGPEVYDQWVAHEIPFDDPQIQEAFEAYSEIALTEGNVQGGGEAIVSTPFGEAGNPSFEDPPKCMLHRQGNFITGFFPEDVQKDLDGNVDVMYFPPYEGGYDGNPILGGGDMAGLFNGEDDEAKQVMEFLTSDEFGADWAQAGGWLSPHATFDASNYPDETTRKMAELASAADVFRFDASDLMPAEVGAGTFWTGMVDWTTGAKDTEEVTADIEASWPSD